MAAGPGGRLGDLSKDLIDFLSVAENIHDFSGDRGGIPIRDIVGRRLEGNIYGEKLYDMIGERETKSKNFEKEIQHFLEETFRLVKIDEIYDYRSVEHMRFIDCQDYDPKTFDRVMGRDLVIFRVLRSKDDFGNKYLDYNNRTNLIYGLNQFFNNSKAFLNYFKNKKLVEREYLPIIYDASSFSPKYIFYSLDPYDLNIITGIFGGILVEESTHNDSATKLKNSNYLPGCDELGIEKLINGETLTYSISEKKTKRTPIKLLVNHKNVERNQKIGRDENLIDLSKIRLDSIEKVEMPGDGEIKYYLTNNNSYCSAILIIKVPSGRNIGIKMSVFNTENIFNVVKIYKYYNGEPNKLYDELFGLMRITDIEIKIKILMDLKRIGDWGQVMMVKSMGNKAVIFTHDRMLFNFARLNKVPVIFTTFPNVEVGEDEGENSLYVDLVCYTPEVNGDMNKNVSNMIAILSEEIKMDKIRRGLETLNEYKVELEGYFLGEVVPYSIPDDLIKLNGIRGKLRYIKISGRTIDISGGIPDNLNVFLLGLEMLINLVTIAYRVFMEFKRDVEDLLRKVEMKGFRLIREHIMVRLYNNYNVLSDFKNIRKIVKNLTTLFSYNEETDTLTFRTIDITNIASSLFLGINWHTFFSNIQYYFINNIHENPKYTIENIYNLLEIVSKPIKSLIENNREITDDEKAILSFNNPEEFIGYMEVVGRLTELSDELKEELYREIEGNVIRGLGIRGGGKIEDLGYINMDNVNVYFYTYLIRQIYEQKILGLPINLGDLGNYSKIIEIIRKNIEESGEIMSEEELTMEDLIGKPNTRLLIYTEIMQELIMTNEKLLESELLERMERLGLVYEDVLGICSGNILIGDATFKEPKLIDEPLSYDYSKLVNEEIPSGFERKPIEVFGGKIRIMKNSMKNVYLDEMEKEIIKWGIKKGYIHKSNYLDLQKLLEN